MSFPKIPESIDPLAYGAYTAYLEPTDIKRLDDALEGLNETPLSIQKLAQQILLGQWDSLFKGCNRDRFPLQSLRCLKEDQISFMTFATCLLFHNTIFHPGNKNQKIETISIWSNGRINSRAKKMINESMKLVFTSFIEIRKRLNLRGLLKKGEVIPAPTDEKIWTKEQKTNFYNILAQLPKTESSFIILPDIPFETQIKMIRNIDGTLMQKIHYGVGFAALSNLTIKNNPMRMIPSSGMMEAYLRACFPDTALTPVYRATLSTEEGLFRTLEEGGRDVIQPIAFFRDKLPPKIDDALAPARFNEARLHDFYHQWRAAQTPLVDRRLIVKIGQVLLKIKKTRTTPNKYADFIFEKLADMENVMYYKMISNPRTRALFYPHWDEKTIPWYQDASMLVWRTLESRSMDAFKVLTRDPDIDKTQHDFDEILYALVNWLVESEIYKDETYKPMMDRLIELKTHDEIRAQYHDELILFTYIKYLFQKRVGIIPKNAPPIAIY